MIPFILSIVGLLSCAIFGKYLLSICGVRNLSLMGGGFVVGYGVFGLLLLLSLKYMGNLITGALLYAGLLGAMMVYQSILQSNNSCISSKHNQDISHIGIHPKCNWINIRLRLIEFLIFAVVVSWAIAIGLTFLPLSGLLTADLQYQLPDIGDLPKHLFAELSLYSANRYPPPSPFLVNEIFAYNYLFYLPPVFIAKLIGDQLATIQNLSFVIIAIAIALPMTILDIVRNITKSKIVHLLSVLLATWVGGFTPLIVAGKPGIGFFLYSENLLTSFVWVDEMLVSLIFVPQHIFAVLCGLITMFILTNICFKLNDYKRIFLAGITTVAGVLSSFILLPHLIISLVLGILFTYFLQWRAVGCDVVKNIKSLQYIVALFLPIFLILPFLIEVLKWSGGTGSIFTVPVMTTQWFFVISSIGMVAPLAIFGLARVFQRKEAYGIDSYGNRMLVNMLVMITVGLIGLLFFGYPDAGIKSGLWVRITLVPFASFGLLVLLAKFANQRIKALVLLVLAVFFFGTAIVNFPTIQYFVQSAWRPIDPNVKPFVLYIRSLPDHSRIALFSSTYSTQYLVALSGRQIDFDFSSIRADSYMPPEGRIHAMRFWDGFIHNNSEIWAELDKSYDYLIALPGSPANGLLLKRYTNIKNIGGYTIYKTGLAQ